MNEIKPWLYLGGIKQALMSYRRLGITHVLTLCDCAPSSSADKHDDSAWDEYGSSCGSPKWKREIDDSSFEGAEWLNIALSDGGASSIKDAMVPIMDFVREMKKDPDGKLAVHCQKGVNRAPTVAIALLMMIDSMTLRDAATLVRSKRPCASPCPEYLTQLLQLELQLTSIPSITKGELFRLFKR